MKKTKAFLKQFGGKVNPELQIEYSVSPNWKKDKFVNLEETKMEFSIHSMPKLLYKQFFEKEGREPISPLPIKSFDRKTFLAPSDKPKFIWYGHSVLLMRWNGKTILMDPMLGPNASPIAPFATKRFAENTLQLIDEFPDIDLALMTHDHYDHLDLQSIENLKSKTKKWYVAIGVKRHLTAWGIDDSAVREFDWYDEDTFEGIDFTFTPSRHFSGRGLTDRAKSLWGGWVMKSHNANIYWSGDGGYGDHFKTIGKKYGPFDFGFIECGQYNENWHQIHMYPEEAVQAALDAGVKTSMPVHWCGFALAQHSWKEPANRFVAEANKLNLNSCTPNLGELFTVDSLCTPWWDSFE